MRIDHVVLWVEDPLASLSFFVEMLGCEAVRLEEYRERKVGFPSVRIADDAIIDLMPKTAVPHVSAQQFGARGVAPEAFYFKDLDGNVLEARYY